MDMANDSSESKKRRKLFTKFLLCLKVFRNLRKDRKVCRYGDWSELSPDVLRMIFETLSPIDFHQAKTVCSNWYRVWKTCVNPPPCPWRIIHQGTDQSSSKDRENTRKLDNSLFDKSYCMASSGNWVLVVSFNQSFHLFDLVTRKWIDLPSIYTHLRGDVLSYILRLKNSAVLWFDETTGDYVVAWVYRQRTLFSYKKGDAFWSNLDLQGTYLGFRDLTYKNSKLYVLTTDNHIKIFDFSGGLPRGEINENPYRNHPFSFDEEPWEYVWKRKIAIEKSGEVLIILSLKEVKYEDRLLFYVFKMNLESYKWERASSIGDEMLVFGDGVTVKAPVTDLGDGIKSDSIYFVKDDVWPDHQDCVHRDPDCGVFDIATSRIKWSKKSRFYINKTQWFVPGVAY